ncbi:MAG: transcription antitermination factor NusB [Phycisphaerae bacterium]|nr:transcription antitermination factor NusB [Phycisphaerae bacterium]
MTAKRRCARRLALQGLCCLDVQGDEARPAFEQFIDDSRENTDTRDLARRLLETAWADRAACDDLLVRHARHWQLERLALVDRNILRLATAEMRARHAPDKVVISEALHLAQELSTAESPRFVNGVLDAVARELRQNGSKDASDTNDNDVNGDRRG